MSYTEADWMPDRYGPPAAAAAVEHVEHRVVGPPGCGKTTWLARQAVNAAGKYTAAGVAICSLTRAAAAEIGGRDTGIPPQNVGTLHAHAYRALDRPRLMETSEGLKEWNDWVGVAAYRISSKHAADPENANPDPAGLDSDGIELLQGLGVLRARMTDPRLWPPRIQHFAARWQQFKDRTGRLDFTDLIARALDDVEQMPSQPDVILVDEAQDMSALEMALIRKWGAHARQLVVVGDPDQALYTWRGADPDSVFGTEAASVKVLAQSYRVPAAVHAFAVDWIEQMPGRLPVAYQPRVEDDGQPAAGQLHHANLAWRDPEPLIDTLRADLDDGRSVMVLTTCGYMLAPLVARLRALGEPFWNPYRISFHPWNPLNAASRMLAFLRPQPAVWGDEQRMWTWDDLRLWTDPMQAQPALRRGAKALIKRRCARGRFGPEDTHAHDTIDLVDLMANVLAEDEHVLQGALDGDCDWWAHHLRHTEAKTQSYPLSIVRRHGARRLKELTDYQRDAARLEHAPRLIVGTIHSVKGGQADSVYLFPDLSPTAYWNGWKIDAEHEAHKSIVRQIYVGATRARDKLVLCQPSGAEAVRW